MKSMNQELASLMESCVMDQIAYGPHLKVGIKGGCLMPLVDIIAPPKVSEGL